jgi:hypothetical protein
MNVSKITQYSLNLFCIALFFLIYYFYNQRILIENQTDIILARYNEPLSYLSKKQFKNFRKIIIYNKGPTLDHTQLPANTIVRPLPNVGYESHTYLYHMLHFRDDLAEHNIFIPASYPLTKRKNKGVKTILKKYHYWPTYFHGEYLKNDSEKELWHFQVDYYKFNNNYNTLLNTQYNPTPCHDRPFGVWFEKNFPGQQINFITLNGIFSVSKNRILQNDPGIYQSLISYLDKDPSPESGHYMERCWKTLLE